MNTTQIIMAVVFFSLIFIAFAAIVFISGNYNLDNIKSKTVGDGQYGTARWSTEKEIDNTFKLVSFDVENWRKGINRPTAQGIIVGCRTGKKNSTTALIDTDDIHALMLGAAGTGKTAFFLYPNLEYACASGMSFLTSDTKGDLCRNYGNIAKKCYGYNVAVIDLRNPTKSDGNNILHLVNKYMDLYKQTGILAHKARAEKYAKIVGKTIIMNGSDGNYGQNAFFYDSAEGILTAAILIIAEFCEPEKRHIVSVFKIIQDLLAPSKVKNKNQFQVLVDKLPAEHKARWFAGSSLNSAEQSMASVLSTAMSRLNSFLDSELEQILCFDTAIDAEKFCNTKSAIFIILPEEDETKFFMVSLIVQQLYREILSVADETEGKLKNRVMMYLDEFGTLPKIESAEMMFSASRSRRVSIVPIIQSFAQLYKNYGKEGGEIILDNCQVGIYAGFSPNSESSENVSKMLGNKTVLTGSISKGKKDSDSQSLQMMQRALMTPDELKSMKKGNFVITKTGLNPMRSTFKLFFEWGISFTTTYEITDKAAREVKYANKDDIEKAIDKYMLELAEKENGAVSEKAEQAPDAESQAEADEKSEESKKLKV